MFTTVPSRKAIPEPSTAAARTQRPWLLSNARPSSLRAAGVAITVDGSCADRPELERSLQLLGEPAGLGEQIALIGAIRRLLRRGAVIRNGVPFVARHLEQVG